jgi:superfamily II DNA/RNA helicase
MIEQFRGDMCVKYHSVDTPLFGGSPTLSLEAHEKNSVSAHILIGTPPKLLKVLNNSRRTHYDGVVLLVLDDTDVLLCQGLKSTVMQVFYLS